MADLFQTALLFATFNVALIAVAIANYAVSASFLGRESRLSRARMERRKSRLIKELDDLKKKPSDIGNYKDSIKKAESDISNLNRRIFFLSWEGAVVIPSIFFLTSFISAVVAMNLPTISDLSWQLLTITIITLTGGFFFVLVVIRVVDSAAKNIPVPEFKIKFDNLTTEISLKPKEQRIVNVTIYNDGEDIAEEIDVYRNFPEEFIVDPTGYNVIKYGPDGVYPNHTCLNNEYSRIHPNIMRSNRILVTAPEKNGKYEITISVYERKIGHIKQILTIKVE